VLKGLKGFKVMLVHRGLKGFKVMWVHKGLKVL
jgi:hypothetical protein